LRRECAWGMVDWGWQAESVRWRAGGGGLQGPSTREEARRLSPSGRAERGRPPRAIMGRGRGAEQGEQGSARPGTGQGQGGRQKPFSPNRFVAPLILAAVHASFAVGGLGARRWPLSFGLLGGAGAQGPGAHRRARRRRSSSPFGDRSKVPPSSASARMDILAAREAVRRGDRARPSRRGTRAARAHRAENAPELFRACTSARREREPRRGRAANKRASSEARRRTHTHDALEVHAAEGARGRRSSIGRSRPTPRVRQRPPAPGPVRQRFAPRGAAPSAGRTWSATTAQSIGAARQRPARRRSVGSSRRQEPGRPGGPTKRTARTLVEAEAERRIGVDADAEATARGVGGSPRSSRLFFVFFFFFFRPPAKQKPCNGLRARAAGRLAFAGPPHLGRTILRPRVRGTPPTARLRAARAASSCSAVTPRGGRHRSCNTTTTGRPRRAPARHRNARSPGPRPRRGPAPTTARAERSAQQRSFDRICAPARRRQSPASHRSSAPPAGTHPAAGASSAARPARRFLKSSTAAT